MVSRIRIAFISLLVVDLLVIIFASQLPSGNTILSSTITISVILYLILAISYFGKSRLGWWKEEEEAMSTTNSENVDRDTFTNVIKRYEEIELTTLAKLLDTDDIALQRWLITLPDSYGFSINKDTLIINQEQLGDQIDELFEAFQQHEGGTRQKLE